MFSSIYSLRQSQVRITTGLILLAFTATTIAQDSLPELQLMTTKSKLDGEVQAVTYWAPDDAADTETPLFVFLHSWSSGYEQDNSKWLQEAIGRGWIYIQPDFRGRNSSPKACGSKYARQDVLDAIQMAKTKFKIDSNRIYLAGVSGGGHMAMLMAGHHPGQFSAVSAWVGISDIAEWYEFHLKDGEPQKYAKMIIQCFGKPPKTSNAIDQEYRDRSPLFRMHNIGDLPIDIYTGVNDGHTGSVPVSHSIRAFNKLAESHGNKQVSEAEIKQLWTNRRLSVPLASDLENDSTLGRTIFLRRTSRQSRLTVFDGGHESITMAACEWLTKQRRQTKAFAATK